MKLIFLSHDSNLNGGAQKCLFELLQGIKATHPNYETYLIFPREGDMIEKCKPYINGYTIIRSTWWITDKKVNIRLRFSIIKKLLKDIIKIASYCQKIKPDYTITNTIVIPPLAIACKLLNIKHLWFIHEIPDTWNNNRFIFKTAEILNITSKISYKIIVPSNYTKAYYSQYISENKIQVINQAVRIDPTINSARQNNKEYTIALIGSFDTNKGQMELLQAVNKITANNCNLHCYLVGNDCGSMEECNKYIRENKLTSFVSIIPFSSQVQLYYSQSDVLVVCSALETFGRVAVEAQKCGLPVILSNVGANPERIKDKKTGLLYEKGNIDDLIDKIEYLRDINMRAQFSKNIDFVELEKYNSTNFANEFIQIIKAF